MAPLLHLSTYTEEFSSLGRGKPAQPRPSSAHRRNNPHPRPDFLLPRKLQTACRSSRSVFQTNMAPLTIGRLLFPPIRHLSFHYQGPPPDGKRVRSLSAVHSDNPERDPFDSSKVCVLPPAGRTHKAQIVDPYGRDGRLQPSQQNIQSQLESFKFLQQRPGHLSDTQQKTGDPKPHVSSGSSAGYSCFHVVKPYQAGYYIIHPEFVSEHKR